MYHPRLGTVNWAMVSTAVGMGIGLILTVGLAWLLYKAFPQMRRPAVFFWVMFGILMVTSLGGIVIFTHLQLQNSR